MSAVELFNKYKHKFEDYQRYFEAPYSSLKSFIKSYENVRNEFLKYKRDYENKTKDNRKNSSFISLGKKSYEFITPKKFTELMRITIISDIERKIINESYIGSSFSWHLNSKLRKGEKLKEEDILVKTTLQNIINKNIISENYICKKYIHYDYIEKNFGIFPSKIMIKN